MLMDRQRVREQENKCIQEQPPACTSACPIHVDARGMIECMRKSDFSAAFTIFKRFVDFPRIISRICDHPCEAKCKRNDLGGPIQINALERACVDYSAKRAGGATFSSRKSQRIAVVGGGLSGLTVAFDLATKGFGVVVFEATDRLAGRLRNLGEDRLPQKAIDEDLAALGPLGIEVRLNTPVGESAQAKISLSALTKEFDAVYLGVGPSGAASFAHDLKLRADGRFEIDQLTFATSNDKVFAGGTQRYAVSPDDFSPITSTYDGRYAVLSLERHFQHASLSANREQQGAFETKLFTSTKGIEPASVAPMAKPEQGYSQEEALAEASRCLHCECLECVKVCEYLANYKKYPKRYIRDLYNNWSIVLGVHSANPMLNACAECGLCGAVCPEHLDMGEYIRSTREASVEINKMPPSVHQFALHDMAFSTSDKFTLARHQPGHDASSYVFFPGCQLSASSPDQVFQIYGHLQKSIQGGVGLMLGCCGAPANWSGRRELFDQTIAEIQKQWQGLGSPRIITACSSCYQMFKRYAPAMPIESLWTVLDKVGLPSSASQCMTKTVAIHDACTTRHDTDVQDGVRHLLKKLGVQTIELEGNRDFTTCCGYGGLMSLANPGITQKVINRRIHESDADYLTYCAMCRDNFARKGKRTFHLLDLICCGDGKVDPAERQGPTLSNRQENRAKLKARFLHEMWGEKVSAEEEFMELITSPEVEQVMEERMITADDIRTVIAHAESTGEKMEDTANGSFLATYRPAAVAYWVEYAVQGKAFAVRNVYSHRMEVS
jgi:glutamate synthase (NADPH) small chain